MLFKKKQTPKPQQAKKPKQTPNPQLQLNKETHVLSNFQGIYMKNLIKEMLNEWKNICLVETVLQSNDLTQNAALER